MFRNSVQLTAAIVCDAARALYPFLRSGIGTVLRAITATTAARRSTTANEFWKAANGNVFGIWSRQQPQSMISHRHL
jgi:hypothetical protein